MNIIDYEKHKEWLYQKYNETYGKKHRRCWSFKTFNQRAIEDNWIFVGNLQGYAVIKKERLFNIYKLVIAAGDQTQISYAIKSLASLPMWCVANENLEPVLGKFAFSMLTQPEQQTDLIPKVLHNYLNQCVDSIIDSYVVRAILPELGTVQKCIYVNSVLMEFVGVAKFGVESSSLIM